MLTWKPNYHNFDLEKPKFWRILTLNNQKVDLKTKILTRKTKILTIFYSKTVKCWPENPNITIWSWKTEKLT